MKHPQLHTTIVILGILISITVIVLAGLQIIGVWENAACVFIPLLGLHQLCQAYIQWNHNHSRKIAIINIAAAVFIFICSIVVFFVK
ncbi:MAG: DUF4181 domain-containing protein [Ruminococcaceae bacterium]|nr:DUF4181 domain-containing protein [Oscillospiraceae bacterium]